MYRAATRQGQFSLLESELHALVKVAEEPQVKVEQLCECARIRRLVVVATRRRCVCGVVIKPAGGA